MEYKELPGYWEDFKICAFLRFDEAAALLAGDNPHRVHDCFSLSDKALLILRELKASAVTDWDFGRNAKFFSERGNWRIPFEELSENGDVPSHTKAPIFALARWADSKGIPHHWPREWLNEAGEATATNKPAPAIPYTEELQAAIDAYEAVRVNPEATQGRTPRKALLSWLEENRPNLGAKARDRIATMCNWEPQGGAPATPTGRGSE